MEFLIIVIVAFIIWFFRKDKKTVQLSWFPVNNAPLDTAIQSFGKMCNDLSKSIPEDKRTNVIIRVTVDRSNVTAKLAIDTLAVDLQKLLPGYKAAEINGWEYNDRYLEGTAQRIDLPDSWAYAPLTENIIRDFREGFPNAHVVNKSNDTNDIEWVIFDATR